MNPESHFKIVGGTEENKIEVSEKVAVAPSRSGNELFGEHLLETTEDERSVIFQAVEYVNDLARNYGSNITVDPDRVFILKQGSVPLLTENEEGGAIASGYCNRITHSIAVERKSSVALLSKTVAHEAFHLATPFSIQVDSENDSYGDYRSGLSMHGRVGEGTYFAAAEEAIVETLAQRFFHDVTSSDPKYKEEIERTEKIKHWILSRVDQLIPDAEHAEYKNKFIGQINDIFFLPDSEHVLDYLDTSDEEPGSKYEYFQGWYGDELASGSVLFSRREEREKFDTVLEQITIASKGKLGTKEELFDEFTRAHFTGNYLSLGRRIEESLGKGSFRKIAVELGEMDKGNLV